MDKKVAIMQPYFFPYIGYFQLIKSVDEFVIYDNIQYTKKGWINRNRILVNGQDQLITLPLKKDSDFLDVVDREISSDWIHDRIKLLNKINGSYKKAPYYGDVYPIIEKCILNSKLNLFEFIFDSLKLINNYLDIKTKIIVSSDLKIDHSLKSKDKVIAICNELGSSTYINSIGGMSLYNKDDFKSNGVTLNFIKSNNISYKQYDNEFVAWLSILDVMMFNPRDLVIQYTNSYSIL